MDREYKEMMYGALFDELDRLQTYKLHNDSELQKEALNIGGFLQGAKRGVQTLAKNPGGFLKNIKRSYQGKAPGGIKGIPKRIGNVLKTDEGKLLAGAVGGTAALGVGSSLVGQRQ